MRDNNYLIYLCVGKELYRYQLMYSLASFYKAYGEQAAPGIILFTDAADYFTARLPDSVVINALSQDQITHFQNGLEYIPRIKIEVLKSALAQYEGNFLFVDLDTCYLKPVEELFEKLEQGYLILHKFEGNINQMAKRSRTGKKVKAGIENNAELLAAKGITIGTDVAMYNSGAIGFTSGTQGFIDNVLNFIDVFYPATKIWVTEQLGVSWYFQSTAEVLECDDYIFHYHHFEEFKKQVLPDFFAYHSASPVEKIMGDVDKISPLELIKPKTEYKEMSEIRKGLRRLLRGKKWQLPEYRFWQEKE